MSIDINFLKNHRNEFTPISKEYDCEIPQGVSWRVVVRHDLTGIEYEYYEEDCYLTLEDQLQNSPHIVELVELGT